MKYFLKPFFCMFCFVFSLYCVYAEIPSGTFKDFIKIKGGTFTMGGSIVRFPGNKLPWALYEVYGIDEYDETQHQVTVSDFFISKYKITQWEYVSLTNENPSPYKGDALPVSNVRWYEAIIYCNLRSKKEGLKAAYEIVGGGKLWTDYMVRWDKTANGYRLPTEAEWEYACRAGTTTDYYTGRTINTSLANVETDVPTPVGSYPANPWGLYDILGNGGEWCYDWYGVYNETPQINPTGPYTGKVKIVRNQHYYLGLRAASRYYANPGLPIHGFRIVRNAQ